jgi:hypothetical protein
MFKHKKGWYSTEMHRSTWLAPTPPTSCLIRGTANQHTYKFVRESVDMQENAQLGEIKNLNVGRMCTNCCHDLQTQMTHKKRDFLEFICLQIYQPSGDGCKSFK